MRARYVAARYVAARYVAARYVAACCSQEIIWSNTFSSRASRPGGHTPCGCRKQTVTGCSTNLHTSPARARYVRGPLRTGRVARPQEMIRSKRFSSRASRRGAASMPSPPTTRPRTPAAMQSSTNTLVRERSMIAACSSHNQPRRPQPEVIRAIVLENSPCLLHGL